MVHDTEAFAPAACLAVSPSTPVTFLVGADTGSVTRGALHAPQPSPQVRSPIPPYQPIIIVALPRLEQSLDPLGMCLADSIDDYNDG